jgi:hypothetical protein
MPVLRVMLAFLLAAGLLAVANPAEAAYGDRCALAGHNPVAEADLVRSTGHRANMSTGPPTASAWARGATVKVPCGWRSISCRHGSSGLLEDL